MRVWYLMCTSFSVQYLLYLFCGIIHCVRHFLYHALGTIFWNIKPFVPLLRYHTLCIFCSIIPYVPILRYLLRYHILCTFFGSIIPNVPSFAVPYLMYLFCATMPYAPSFVVSYIMYLHSWHNTLYTSLAVSHLLYLLCNHERHRSGDADRLHARK